MLLTEGKFLPRAGSVLLTVILSFVLVGAASAQGLADSVSQLEREVAALQQAVSALEAASQPLHLTVDCAAGEKVANALERTAGRTGPLTITIIETCLESVAIVSRKDVTIQGASAGDGLQAPNPTENVLSLHRAHNIHLNQLALNSGNTGVFASDGTSFFADDITVTDTETAVSVLLNSVGVLTNSVLDTNQAGLFVPIRGVLFAQGLLVANTHGIGVNADGGFAELRDSQIVNSGGLGLFAQNGGAINFSHSTVDGGDGVQVNQGGSANIDFGSVIRNSRRLGVAVHGASIILADVLITDSLETGVGLFNGSRVAFSAGTRIENNGRDGVLLLGGSSIRPEGFTVQNNGGNGISIADTSVAEMGPSTIVNNAGWGIFCVPAPAVAQVHGDPGTVTGNGAGQVSCPIVP